MIIEDIPRRNARRYPNKTAVVYKGTRYTFKELNDRVNSLANALTSTGLEKGDKIAIIADSCNQYLDIFWTTAKTGMVTLPFNPGLSQQDLSYLINNAGARALVFSHNYLALIESLRPQLKDVKHYIVIGASDGGATGFEELISSHPPLEPEVTINDDDLLALGCTSGTTGLPKQTMETYKSLMMRVLGLFPTYDMREESVFLMAAPLFWGPSVSLFSTWCFYFGSPFIIASELTPRSILETIEKEGVTIAFMSMALLGELINYPDLDKYDHTSLRCIVGTGAPLPPQAWRRAIEAFGNIFVSLYGTVELWPITYLFLKDIVFEGPPEKITRLRSCGREATNIEVRVVDEQGNDVQPGQLGELIAKGNALIKGYWNAPKATQEAIRGGFFYTGDLATVDEEGYIYLSGRKKDTITSQGKVLIASEIEEIIYRNPQVLEVAVIGVPDKELGEAVKAVVALRKGGKATEEELIKLCQEHLPAYAVPKSVDFIERLPRNPTGKILRHALRKKYA